VPQARTFMVHRSSRGPQGRGADGPGRAGSQVRSCRDRAGRAPGRKPRSARSRGQTAFRNEWIERSPGLAYPEGLLVHGNEVRLARPPFETIKACGSTAKVGSAQSLQDVTQR